MNECIAFTGGGTGGHIFPALAVIEELFRSSWTGRIIWIGSSGGMEASILAGRRIEYFGVPSGKLRRYPSLQNVVDLFRIAAGFWSSFLVLRKQKPQLLFSKGGYVSVPPVIAAAILGIPVYTHESDLEPGLATRINARFAEKIFISFADTALRFAPKRAARIEHTGNPVRRELLAGDVDAGKKLVGCSDGLPLLLVLGGSQGSQYINRLISACLDKLRRACFVVHQMGEVGYQPGRKNNYYPTPFFREELPHVMAAADLVVCRSGANTLWELAALGKPSILIPLPSAASRGDQISNAEFFFRRGAALVLEQQYLTDQIFLENVSKLLDNKIRLAQMARNAQRLSFSDSAARIAALLREGAARFQ